MADATVEVMGKKQSQDDFNRLQCWVKARERVELFKGRWEEETEKPTGLKTGIVSVTTIYDEQGKCTHLVGSVHDITERKKAEDTLRSKEVLYRSIFENNPLGIFHFDNNLIITDCNEELVRIIGSTH